MGSLMKNGFNLKITFHCYQFCPLYFKQQVRIAWCKMKKNRIITNSWTGARIIKKSDGCLYSRNKPTIALGEI